MPETSKKNPQEQEERFSLVYKHVYAYASVPCLLLQTKRPLLPSKLLLSSFSSAEESLTPNEITSWEGQQRQTAKYWDECDCHHFSSRGLSGFLCLSICRKDVEEWWLPPEMPFSSHLVSQSSSISFLRERERKQRYGRNSASWKYDSKGSKGIERTVNLLIYCNSDLLPL